MPGEDGYSLIRKVRERPPEKGGTVPAAALTAYARTEDRLHSLRAGFHRHVPKPVQPDELAQIVIRSARLLDVETDGEGAHLIATRSRGTPRVANRLLKRVRDYAEVHGPGAITEEVAVAALELLDIDSEGLDRLDREILRTICEKFSGGPVGLSTLAAAVEEEQDTIEDVYEPYLLQRGLIERTARGRAATRRAFEHLGLERTGPMRLL